MLYRTGLLKPFRQSRNPIGFGLSDNINTKGVTLVWRRKVLPALGHVHMELRELTPCSWVLLAGVET